MTGQINNPCSPIFDTENRIDALLGDAIRDEIVWAIRPNIVTALRKKATTHETFNQSLVRRAWTRRPQLHRKVGRRISVADAGPRFEIFGGILRLWNTENQRLAVGANWEHSSALPGPRLNNSVSNATISKMRDIFHEFPDARGKIAKRLNQASRVVDQIDQLLEYHQPRAVVVASTEHAYLRLLVSRARRRAIPSIYVPHAPATLNRIYADIPADFCLLGFQGDFKYYQGLGIKSEQCRVIGDTLAASHEPSISAGSKKLTGRQTLLFSTGADRDVKQLESAMKGVSSAVEHTGIGVLIAPHPRDREATTRSADRFGLEVFSGRSVEAFLNRQIVVQVSERPSGALLHGLQRGIPTCRWTGVANYVFEEACNVPSVDGQPDQLKEFIGRCPQEVQTNCSTLDDWYSAPGEQAITAREEFIRGTPGAIGAALDSWHFFD